MRIFLDFEASSLNKQSYPIEVGWVRENGESEGHLIRPAPSWLDWDETAEAIHGISRDLLLREGVAHDVVCARLAEIFQDNVVYASAPSWDGHWLSMLLRAAGRPRHSLRLRDSEEAFVEAAQAGQGPAAERIALARKVVEAEPVVHRAVEDARREWAIWREISRSTVD